VQTTIFQTTRHYTDVLLARELVGVSEQALTFADALLEDVRTKRKNGVSSDYDVLRAEVERSSTHAELIRQKNVRNLAVARLLQTIGVSQNNPVTPADELVYRPIRVKTEETMRVAQQNRPELYRAEFAVRMQREAVRVARSAYAPKIDTFFTQKWANPDPHSSMSEEWGEAWTAGIVATLPMFDGFQRRGRLAREKALLEQAEIRLVGLEEAVAFEVKQAILSVHDAEELVESQQMNLKRAEEGLRQVQVGYREGVNRELTVLDAQTALTRARAIHYQALHAHMTARLNLRRAMGTLGLQPEDGGDQAAASRESKTVPGETEAD
jgi:outer membrane protein